MTTSTASRREAKDALYDGFATLARALASGRRAEIVELLCQGERTVEEIAQEIGQSVANTSHHLRVLARAKLVTTRRAGTHIHYRLASTTVIDAWVALRGLAAERLDGLDELAAAYLGNRGEIATITRDELLARLDRGDLVLIDVRPDAEYAAGHIPGAISTPPDRLGLALDELPAEGDVVAYCRGPYCVYADDAVRELQARGRRALRLEEGLPEWRRDGGIVEPWVRTSRELVVTRRWLVVVRGGTDGCSGGDRAAGEDVDSKAASVDERSQESWAAEVLEVGAGLAQPSAPAEHLADVEGSADECAEVDVAGEDVASGGGELDGVAGGGQLVEGLGGNEGEGVAGSVAGAGATASASTVPCCCGIGPAGRSTGSSEATT
jgi:rhodanese-related sulfurtransferase